MKKSLYLIFMSLLCSLSIPVCYSQDTYRLVTDIYQIDHNSKYLIVAKDFDKAAGETGSSNNKRFLTSHPVTKNNDNSIIFDGNSNANIYVMRNYPNNKDITHKQCHWKINALIDGYPHPLATKKQTNNGELALNSELGMCVEYLSIDITPEGVAHIMFDNGPSQHIRYDSDKGRFVCNSKNEYNDVALYRLDSFNFKIDEENSSSDIIVVTSTWKETPDINYGQPISVYYLFNDGVTVTKEEIISNGAIAPGNDQRVEIPRHKEHKTLWIIGEYKPNKIDKVSYSHIFKAELNNTGPGTDPTPDKPTDSTHFSTPKSTGYKYNEPIVIEKDSDVKIYYTLDGSVPVVPANGESPLPPTYDWDMAPVTYLGKPINLTFIAVKAGFSPSSVISLSLSGEAVPQTTLGTHFQKPAQKAYKLNENVTFERDSDVKIYYTLNGTTPVPPDKANGTPMGTNTFDFDNTPITYTGTQLNISFIAVKNGLRPSDVITVVISGESKQTQLGVHFKKPAEKTYALDETVIFLKDTDVKIYYTLDGSDPIVPDKSQGVSMGATTFDLDNTPIIYKGTPLNIKFIAVKKDFLPSEIVSIVINGELKQTQLNVHFKKPAEKSYALNESVVFERDEDVKIYYTLNGTTPIPPDKTNGTAMGTNTFDLDNSPIIYTGAQLNISFVAIKNGFSPSEVVTVVITGETKQTQLDVHFKKPAEKQYAINETVIFLRDTDVKIYYTLDGSEPVAPDKELMIPMGIHTYDLDTYPIVYKGTPLKVIFIAVKPGYRQSESITIQITGELKPTLIDVHFKKPADKQYSIDETVNFLRDKDVKIYYTLDGSNPIAPDKEQGLPMGPSTFDLDTTPIVYKGSILNVKFIAIKNGFGPSEIISVKITGELKPTELNVHFRKPADKQYAMNETVIFLRDSDVKIYYTLDGSQPVVPNGIIENTSIFDLDTTPIIYVGKPIYVKFIAVKEGFKPSEVITVVIEGESIPKTELNSHFYILKEKNYKFKETVRFEKFDDVKIYYTLDGSDPVIPTDKVSSPSTFDIDETPIIYMGETLTLKVIAIKTGLNPSDIILFTLTGEPVPQTQINVHFKRPAEKVYDMNEAIIFVRESDVKIYYTLDGKDPVVPRQQQKSATENTDHDGKTYDLDIRPLIFEGQAMKIKFVAVKKDYLPSEVFEYAIESDASGIADITPDDETPAEYYNLQGIQVIPPLQPGLYIVRRGNKATKVIIR